MKLSFLGANRQVTGSRYLLQTEHTKVLIDCGLFQERDLLDRNWEPFPFDPAEVDVLLLTHVHIDHSGLIPRLMQHGFKGRIISTKASVGLAELVLRDSARIQVEDAAYKARRHRREKRKGKHPEVPLYTEEDVDRLLPLLEPVAYQAEVSLGDGATVKFHDAGHILGSAILELTVSNGGQQRTIVFSGDIGQPNKPLIRDPSYLKHADYVVMESTYGDRDHERKGDDVEHQLEQVINRTVGRGGNVVIPTFAVERAQELMYYISRLVHDDRIPDVHVFLDSPMAVDVTEIFRRFPECFDAETWNLINSKEPPLRFPGLQMSRSVEDSRGINEHRMPCVIMATSGMCTAGRIKHHLRANVGRPESTVLFVGYQGRGTLGRLILDGKSPIRIHGRQWPVRCEIAQIYGFSGHADRQGLLNWYGHFDEPPKHLFLTHGEEAAAEALRDEIRAKWKCAVTVPSYLDEVTLD